MGRERDSNASRRYSGQLFCSAGGARALNAILVRQRRDYYEIIPSMADLVDSSLDAPLGLHLTS
jgi:hypothetical protein